MNRIKSAVLKGKRWAFDWRKPRATDGRWAEVDFDKRLISINPRLRNQSLAASLIDEIFHAHFPDKRNDAVGRFSDDAARVLQAVGFRVR